MEMSQQSNAITHNYMCNINDNDPVTPVSANTIEKQSKKVWNCIYQVTITDRLHMNHHLGDL